MREIAEQYDLQVLRFFMLSAHYRSPLNFSAELMAASKNGLERIITAAENLKYLAANAKNGEMTDAEKVQIQETEKLVTAFEEAMEDDFNTADAIAAIFELVKFANTTADETSSQAYDSALLERIVHFVRCSRNHCSEGRRTFLQKISKH